MDHPRLYITHGAADFALAGLFSGFSMHFAAVS